MNQSNQPNEVRSSDGLASKPPKRGACCKTEHGGRCCCNCRFHLRDYHHCTTVQPPPMRCVCSEPKGWICSPPEFEGAAYSGWSEHGMCEMHDFALKPKKPQPGRAAGGKARAIALTPTRRKEIAVNAAKARWAK